MENAVNNLEKTIKDVGTRLDNAAWKLEQFQKGVINVVKNKPDRTMVSVIELMQNIQKIRLEFNELQAMAQRLNEDRTTVWNELQDEVNTVQSELAELKRGLKAK